MIPETIATFLLKNGTKIPRTVTQSQPYKTNHFVGCFYAWTTGGDFPPTCKERIDKQPDLTPTMRHIFCRNKRLERASKNTSKIKKRLRTLLMRPLESCLAFILKSEASVAEFSEMSRNRMAGFVRCSDWLLEKAAIAELAAAEAAIAL